MTGGDLRDQAQAMQAGKTRPGAEDVYAEFERRRRRQFLTTLGTFFPMIAVIAVSAIDDHWTVALGVCVGVGVSGMALSRWYWRCPACSSHLGQGLFSIRYCRSCGTRLKGPE